MAEECITDTVYAHSQPDTQPVNTQSTQIDLPQDEDSCDSTWGWLHPTDNCKFKALALQKDEYLIGRSPQCDFVINEENCTDNLIKVISKKQFRIFKKNLSSDIVDFYLEDLSMNGTFVNKKKVGKGKKVTLNTNDEIALSSPYMKVYIFAITSCYKSWIPSEKKKDYSVRGFLGNGAYGEVLLAFNKLSEKYVAIKKIKKIIGKEGKIYNEVKILQNLQHPCIVSMEDVFETNDSLFIVLEYISGGELASKIKEDSKLHNEDAKAIFYQLVLALQYLHQKGVAHRDLKPENVLLSDVNGQKLVKVSDFGLSKLLHSKTNLKTFCGTPLYTAPEILCNQGAGQYTHIVDVWSLGVILFLCLSGKLPFSKANSPMPVIEQIIRASYSMSGPEWRQVSPKAASLIRNMLHPNPDQRIKIEQILKHPWLQDEAMKRKVSCLMHSVSSRDENLSPQLLRPFKRRKQEESDTLLRS